MQHLCFVLFVCFLHLFRGLLLLLLLFGYSAGGDTRNMLNDYMIMRVREESYSLPVPPGRRMLC